MMRGKMLSNRLLRTVGVPRFGGNERWNEDNVRQLFDAALWEWVGESGWTVAV